MIKYEDMVQFNRANLEAAMASGKSVAKGMEVIATEMFGYAGKSVEQALEASKQLAACKNANEYIQVQTKLTKDRFEDMVAQTKKLAEIGTGVMKDAVEPVATRFRVAVETGMKSAA